MRKLLVGVAVVAVALFGLAGRSLAGGIGMYVEGATGSGDFEYEPFGSFAVDAEAKGFGLVLDTDLSDRGLFNYRLQVGYERLELPDDFGGALELDGGVVVNTFGFALLRKPTLRWWAGPQIKLGLYDGGLNANPPGDYKLVGVGLGLVSGVNIVGDNLVFSPSFGVMLNSYAGETNALGPVQDINADTTTAFVNLAILFGR
jgi:hypothetical protein